MTSTARSSSGHGGQMLFLVGHGLQTPLSAIRWGCSRLRKMSKGLSKEQQHVLGSIQSQAKVLSGMVNALLLVARVEDGTYDSRQQDIYLHDFLKSFGPFKEMFPGKTSRVTCPKDFRIRTDRGVLESLLEAVSVVIGTASDQHKGLRIQVKEEGRNFTMHFLPEIELSLLRDASSLSGDAAGHMVGGAPGLMLSVISSLSGYLGGFIQVKNHGDAHHVLVLQLPVRHAASSSAAPS